MDYREILVVLKGEGPGHPFRGNQYKTGTGGKSEKPKGAKTDNKKAPKPTKAKPAFIPLKSVRIQGKTEDKKDWANQGGFNAGIGKVQLSDGSEGVVKKCLEPGQEVNEVLAAKVGSVLNAPIRDCVSLGGDKILMPLIEGQTFAEIDENAGGSAHPELDPRIAAFDAVVGNYDRNAGNVILTPDGQQVGIDHGVALDDPADIWDVPDVTQFSKDPAEIQKMTDGLLALEPDFTSQGKDAVFQQMMTNWYNGLVNAGMA